ncbi:MAG: AfsR/SARP family transcriptional regulator [Bacillota bacterium]
MFAIAAKLLQVYTLGKFLIIKDEKIISEQKPQSSKLWELFQYLLCHPGEVKPIEEIIEDLDFDMELVDAKNALENRIYRLRKMLFIDEKYQSGKYIQYKHGGYLLNCKETIWCDALEFEERYNLGEKQLTAGDEKGALTHLLIALDLYQGDYLKNSFSTHWIIKPQVYYRELYLETINTAYDILDELKEYQKIEDICRKAIQIEPFEERPYYILIKTLLKRGHKREAQYHFDLLNTLFIQKGRELPLDFHQLLESNEEFKPQSGLYSLEDIKEKIISNGDDFKIVPAEICKQFADYLIKTKNHNNDSLYLCSISLKFSESVQKKDTYLDYFKFILKENLQRNEIVCQWTEEQFLIFISSVQEYQVEDLLKRFKDSFSDLESQSILVINTDYCEL